MLCETTWGQSLATAQSVLLLLLLDMDGRICKHNTLLHFASPQQLSWQFSNTCSDMSIILRKMLFFLDDGMLMILKLSVTYLSNQNMGEHHLKWKTRRVFKVRM